MKYLIALLTLLPFNSKAQDIFIGGSTFNMLHHDLKYHVSNYQLNAGFTFTKNNFQLDVTPIQVGVIFRPAPTWTTSWTLNARYYLKKKKK